MAIVSVTRSTIAFGMLPCPLLAHRAAFVPA